MCMPYIPYMVLSRYQQAWNHLGIQQAYECSWHFVPISVIKSFQLQELVGKSGKEVVRKVFFRLFELAVVNSMTIFHDVNPDLGQKYTSNTQRENCPDMEFFLVRISPHSDWIQSGKNAGKYGPGKTPYLDTFHLPMNDPQLKGNTFQNASTQQGSAVYFVGIRRKPMENLPSRKPPRFGKNTKNLSVKTALKGKYAI